MISFAPFQGASHALENINDISEGLMPEYLHTVLDANLPKPDKKNKVTLGVSERSLSGKIKEAFPGLECETADTSEVVADLLRGVRLHAHKLLKQLQEDDIGRAQMALGLSYSRAKVKFNINRNDNHIIQAISTLDQLDKAVNTFSMRVREWYSWHFPELIRIVSENQRYARLALHIGDKKRLEPESAEDLAALLDDDVGLANQIIEAARHSMGQDMSEQDMQNIMSFAQRVVKLSEYRKRLSGYLVSKMGVVAPNLAALIGEVVGARLISHAGSLTNLCKYPASTVQILGAEKALFRALKTKSATPKYGLLYHSSFIGRAGMRNKGRISRFLANKCSLASRIDNFSDMPSTRFGDALKKQVEERLEFYASGATPSKNLDVMKTAMDSVLADMEIDGMDEDGGLAMPPVKADMNGALPVKNDLAMNEDKKAKKLSKEEKKLMKREKKKQANLPADETATHDPGAAKEKIDVNGAGNGSNEDEKREKKKRKSEADGESRKKKRKEKPHN